MTINQMTAYLLWIGWTPEMIVDARAEDNHPDPRDEGVLDAIWRQR